MRENADADLKALLFIVVFTLTVVFAPIGCVVICRVNQNSASEKQLLETNSTSIEVITCRIVKIFPVVRESIYNSHPYTEYYFDVENLDNSKYIRLQYPDEIISGHPYVASDLSEKTIKLEPNKIFTLKMASEKWLVDVID